jgi:putative acetyltransferase
MIRPEKTGDMAAVRRVLTAAFPTPMEAKLVDDLRSAGDLMLSLVADQGGILGHVAFSRLKFAATGLGGAALGPIGVLPEQQRKGIGSALVRDGLSRLAQAGEDAVVVLGDAAFYERFGFSRAAAMRLETPYDGHHLLAKALSEQGSRARGKVRYAPAFAALG